MASQEVVVRFIGDVCFTPDIEAYLDEHPEVRLFADLPNDQRSLTIGNLECVLADEGEPIVGKFACLKAKPLHIRQFENFDALALANNHISDFGHEATVQTIATIEKASIRHCGYGNNLSESLQPLILEKNGVKIGVLNYSCLSTNGQNYATINSPGVAPLALELLEKQISAVKAECDAIFLFVHWGLEHKHQLVLDQMRVARRAKEWGVHAIVGCHGHVLQPIEDLDGTPVVYGIGNCVFGDIPYKFADADGHLQTGVKKLDAKHRECMIPEFSVTLDGGTCKVELTGKQYYKFNNMSLQPCEAKDLTFDPDSSKALLEANATFFAEELKSTSEISYEAIFGGAYFGYYYNSPMVAPIGKAEKMDRFVKNKWSRIYSKYRK